MFKKVLFLLLVTSCNYHFSMAQYTDDAPDSKDTDSTGSGNKEPMINLKDKGVAGLEFMFNGGNGSVYAELSPFVGYMVAKPFLVGAGVHGSFLGGGNLSRTYYGAHAFGRLIIAERFFLHAEYSTLNGFVRGSAVQRKWVSSPIYGIGMMNGSSSWFMIGYAQNTDYQIINPFGALVYRIGLYF